MKDYIIVGAGLSGLTTAFKIKKMNLGSVLVLEKSKGVGGRLATRRTLETRFDHGAQFYRSKVDINELHLIWKENNLNSHWFNLNTFDHWCSKEGMTNFAKFLAKEIEVQLDKLVYSVCFENNYWKVTSDKNECWTTKNLIISAPLPQVTALLNRSEIKQSYDLEKIEYSKALIGLVTLESDLKISDSGYEEFTEGHFFSISDQKQKGVSKIPAITITMSAQFSENEFEKSDDIILEKIIEQFLKKYPHAKIRGSVLKKWRYCRPNSIFEFHHLEVAPNLFLIGDAFGGSSLIGAVRSAESLYSNLKKH